MMWAGQSGRSQYSWPFPILKVEVVWQACVQEREGRTRVSRGPWVGGHALREAAPSDPGAGSAGGEIEAHEAEACYVAFKH